MTLYDIVNDSVYKDIRQTTRDAVDTHIFDVVSDNIWTSSWVSQHRSPVNNAVHLRIHYFVVNYFKNHESKP